MARPASHPVPQTRVLALTKTTVASPEALQATSSSNNVPWQCNICSPRPEEAEDRGLALTPEARALVEAWRVMCCRNASLIEFAPVLTRLVNCNTAPLMLGAGQSANYIIGASG